MTRTDGDDNFSVHVGPQINCEQIRNCKNQSDIKVKCCKLSEKVKNY